MLSAFVNAAAFTRKCMFVHCTVLKREASLCGYKVRNCTVQGAFTSASLYPGLWSTPEWKVTECSDIL